MKIIHCADVHLGSSLTSNFDEKTAKVRNGELFSTFSRMLDYADEQGVSALIIAGDLFDKDTGISTIKRNVFAAIQNHRNLEVYYLRGNHDNAIDDVDFPDNLHTFTDSWSAYQVAGSPKVRLYGVELTKGNNEYIYSLLNMNEDDFNIVTLHGQESLSDGKSDGELINLRALENRGIDYLALGHIHAYKMAKLDSRGTYCYSGTLEGRGFDEPGKHGFVLLDVNEEFHSYRADFIPFASREIFHEQVDISDATTSYDAALIIRKHLNEVGITQADFVEVILSGELAIDAEMDEQLILSQIQDMAHYVKIKDKTAIKVDYSKYEADQSLKGEFVRNVLNDNGLTEQQRNAVIKLGLDALAGKEL